MKVEGRSIRIVNGGIKEKRKSTIIDNILNDNIFVDRIEKRDGISCHKRVFSLQDKEGICWTLFQAKNRYNSFKLKWYFKLYWLQKEENIRYVVNLLFLIIGSYLTYKQIK